MVRNGSGHRQMGNSSYTWLRQSTLALNRLYYHQSRFQAAVAPGKSWGLDAPSAAADDAKARRARHPESEAAKIVIHQGD